MLTPPKDRLEIVLMADQPTPIHLWVQSTGELAKRFEFNKEKSVRVAGGAAIAVLFLLYVAPAMIVMLLLLSLMILFPMKLVGMAGYHRGE